ncbi:MAG TPA: cytochrome c [Hyphomicrobiaceae bacterium]|jgi:cytochrome c553
MKATDLVCAAAVMAAALLLGGPSYAAGDAEAGRQKALRCQTCHGLDGVARIPDAPHIGGQNEFYLINSLKAYKTGLRQNDMMNLIVSDLSDQDIADLAAYFASLDPKNE